MWPGRRSQVEWEVALSCGALEERIRPWVTRGWVSKKMEEYLGEDEPTLVNFVLDKLAARTAAAEVEAEVAKVLDEEAEPFTVKLWRMLLFEIKRAKATPS
ncbi:hypothetical protein EMIHUDRAFT_211507 [Emiliania huxleyi CCMP1516]|uniref:PWI domain-containing protein n=4 Tax=Emiliania huxleyi TaxID=2903 RepID=A0A0D3IVR1_EMIH1|nr:hypothetical protein EMIHUDRAFT_211507 [Emiliania huxleyi CCMP1516]EOD15346.1 hypothetical protein EMIHUDRAFT_211507 [Emiliania huxleyi CCMP1516]|eukprot:XP_005767775.1 hypothetical protein EMIHUDRAFT_211507 [Emiliania huxleyi CCMP1516]